MKIVKAVLANPQIVRARPAVNAFFIQYLRKFTVKDIGGNLIVHSHLPPLNSKAYSRFVNEHLLKKQSGPSHAQVGVTNACPQRCVYCYNKDRTGRVMRLETIKQTIQALKEMGVFWIGLTGGEPLLNKDLAHIVETIGDDCAGKLFTTGCTLTRQRALELKKAGLFSVSISLDSWKEAEHDKIRQYPGAYKAALKAIDIFKSIGGIQVSVSAVLSKKMLKREVVEEYLAFLEGLGVDEAWLSETKPSAAAYWKRELIVTDAERDMLIALQDEYNKRRGITVNYLGHFEDRSRFGCSAGQKMVYVDAFGDVSPCVFIPMNFGNVQERPLQEIFADMSKRFPAEECCFMNKNFEILQHASGNRMPIIAERSIEIMDTIEFGPLPKFYQLLYR